MVLRFGYYRCCCSDFLLLLGFGVDLGSSTSLDSEPLISSLFLLRDVLNWVVTCTADVTDMRFIESRDCCWRSFSSFKPWMTWCWTSASVFVHYLRLTGTLAVVLPVLVGTLFEAALSLEDDFSFGLVVCVSFCVEVFRTSWRTRWVQRSYIWAEWLQFCCVRVWNHGRLRHGVVLKDNYDDKNLKWLWLSIK